MLVFLAVSLAEAVTSLCFSLIDFHHIFTRCIHVLHPRDKLVNKMETEHVVYRKDRN